MIFVTGDCHSTFEKFNTKLFPEQKEMTKEDYVIICGDFGGIWDKDESGKEELWWLKWLENKPFTTLFIDGNHENFDRLYAYPVESWKGGKIHKIRPSIIHLMRGQVFDIDGIKFFTFGGARSHDISDGILECDDPNYKRKKKRLDRGRRPYRINRVNWWAEEMPTIEEMEEGCKNLETVKNEVDFIITHCCPSSTQMLIGGKEPFPSDELTEYFQELRERVHFKKWFFGHYHDNKSVNEKEQMLHDQIIRIA